jgi:hypothetical protein
MTTVLLGLLISYAAIVAHWNGAAIGPVPLAMPAAGALIAASLSSSSFSVVWPFAIGLAADAHGQGPLGLHAAILTVMTPRWSRNGEFPETWRWSLALFVIGWGDGVIPAAIHGLAFRSGSPFDECLLEATLSAGTTALVCGAAVDLVRRVTHRPLACHHIG